MEISLKDLHRASDDIADKAIMLDLSIKIDTLFEILRDRELTTEKEIDKIRTRISNSSDYKDKIEFLNLCMERVTSNIEKAKVYNDGENKEKIDPVKEAMKGVQEFRMGEGFFAGAVPVRKEEKL